LEEGVMSQFVRMRTSNISNEDAVKKIRKAPGVKIAFVTEHNGQKIIEIVYADTPTNNQISKNIRRALRPHDFVMWRRRDAKPSPQPRHRS